MLSVSARTGWPGNMSNKSGVLCVFTKVPVPGMVKTRLIPVLGKTKTTELYQTLLTGTLKTACASAVDKVRLYCTPSIDHPVLRECVDDFGIELRLQQGEDLGARMCNALAAGLNEFDYALVLGCDCPWLRTVDLNLASTCLATENELVLGPASDGGYYLLGSSSRQDFLFEKMPWGTSVVLQETRQRLAAAAIDWFELPEYPDLDDVDDLPAYEKLLMS